MLELKSHIAAIILLAIFLWTDRAIKEGTLKLDKDLLLVTFGISLFVEIIAWIIYLGFFV